MHDPAARSRLGPASSAGLVALAILALASCGQGSVATAPAGGRSIEPKVSAPATPPTGPSATPRRTLRYVALGDSYTIGTSVDEPERWPDQLVGALHDDPVGLRLAANLAVNGFTSADVIAVELPRLAALEPEFVTLLIGVNDVVQGVSEATYRANVATILGALRTRLPAARILVVTTPDYTVTPAGADYGDPTARRTGVRRFNDIATELARGQGILVVDIFDISEGAATDRGLVARDGLHPSGRQYGQWVERIAPAARSLLAEPGPSGS